MDVRFQGTDGKPHTLRFPAGTPQDEIERGVDEFNATLTPKSGARLDILSADTGAAIPPIPEPINPLSSNIPQGQRIPLSGLGGANEVIAQGLGAPVDLINRGLGLLGLDSERPFGGSESLRRGMRSTRAQVGTEGLGKLSGPERFANTVGQAVGATTLGLLPSGAGARALGVAASAVPRSTAGAVGRAAVQPFRMAPGAATATELGIGTASGVGQGVAENVAPGSQTGQLIGALAPSLAAPLVGATVRGAVRRPGAAPSIQRSVDAARSTGADITVGQATSGRRGDLFKRLEATLSKIPGSAGIMARADKRQQGQLASRISTLVGKRVSPETAGVAVKSGLLDETNPQSFISRFKTAGAKLFDTIRIDPQSRVPISATTNALERMSRRIPGAEALSKLLTPKIATDLNSALRGATGNSSTLQYQTLKELRTQVGEAVAAAKGGSGKEKALKRVYAAITEDMQLAATQAGQLDNFNAANKFWRENMKLIDDVIKPVIGRKKAPEKVFGSLKNIIRDTPSSARAVFNALPPRGKIVVRRTFVRDLGRAKGSAEGEFSAETFLTNWRNTDDASKDVLFPPNSAIRRNLDKIAEVATSRRAGARSLFNPSGTAAATANVAGLATLGTTGAFAFGGGSFQPLIGALTVAGGANVAARLLTWPKGVAWLAKGAELPASQLPGHAARLVEILRQERDPQIRAAGRDFLMGLRKQISP